MIVACVKWVGLRPEVDSLLGTVAPDGARVGLLRVGPRHGRGGRCRLGRRRAATRWTCSARHRCCGGRGCFGRCRGGVDRRVRVDGHGATGEHRRGDPASAADGDRRLGGRRALGGLRRSGGRPGLRLGPGVPGPRARCGAGSRTRGARSGRMGRLAARCSVVWMAVDANVSRSDAHGALGRGVGGRAPSGPVVRGALDPARRSRSTPTARSAPATHLVSVRGGPRPRRSGADRRHRTRTHRHVDRRIRRAHAADRGHAATRRGRRRDPRAVAAWGFLGVTRSDPTSRRERGPGRRVACGRRRFVSAV